MNILTTIVTSATITQASVGFNPRNGALTELRFEVTISRQERALIRITSAPAIAQLVTGGAIRTTRDFVQRQLVVAATRNQMQVLGLTRDGGRAPLDDEWAKMHADAVAEAQGLKRHSIAA